MTLLSPLSSSSSIMVEISRSNSVFLCSSACLWTHCVAQVARKLAPSSCLVFPDCWDYNHEPLCLDFYNHSFTRFLPPPMAHLWKAEHLLCLILKLAPRTLCWSLPLRTSFYWQKNQPALHTGSQGGLWRNSTERRTSKAFLQNGKQCST